nr:hypothetical protein [Tanacetum cinerariifolium]
GEGKQGQNRVRHPRMQGMLQLLQRRGHVLWGFQWNAEGEDDARQRGVHAALEYTHPQHQTHEQVGRQLYHAQPVHPDQRNERSGRDGQRQVRQLTRVEQGNHDDRAEVVDDRQRHQEQLE